MIIIPLPFTRIALPTTKSAHESHNHGLAEKLPPFFPEKPAENREMPQMAPGWRCHAHNERLWTTVCVPMIGRFMRRYATHGTQERIVERRTNPSDAPLYAPFVIIFAAICAISVPYGA